MATPFFCSDCDAELKPGEAVRKKDGRVICAKCERKIREKAEAKRQPDLFVEQQGLFNPSRVRNVPGFKDASGQFHPIRSGKGYNEFLAGDFEPRKPTAKQEAAQKEWERQELEQIRKDVQPKRSLAQFVRASGGIVPGGMYAGEIRRLGFHETGTTGLINQKARQGSQKQTAEYVMDAANAEGYRDRNGEPFTEIGAFLQAVESSAVKGIDKFGKKADSAKTRRAKRLAKAMRNPKPTVSDKISQLRHEGYPQRQAVAVALEEQRAGKVRNGLLSNYKMIKAHDKALIEAAKQRTSLEVIEEQIREIRYDPWYNKPANAASRRIALARLTDRKKDLLAKMKRKNPAKFEKYVYAVSGAQKGNPYHVSLGQVEAWTEAEARKKAQSIKREMNKTLPANIPITRVSVVRTHIVSAKSNPHKSYYGLATKTSQARTKVIAKANAYYRQADKLEKAGKPIQARAAAAKGNALLKRFHASGKYSEGPIGELPNPKKKLKQISYKGYKIEHSDFGDYVIKKDGVLITYEATIGNAQRTIDELIAVNYVVRKRNPRQKSEADTLGVRHPVENPAKAPRGSSEKHWLVTADVSGKYDAYPKYESAQILAVNKTQALKAARPQLLAKYPSARRFEVAGPFHDRLSASYAIKAERASIARHKRKRNPIGKDDGSKRFAFKMALYRTRQGAGSGYWIDKARERGATEVEIAKVLNKEGAITRRRSMRKNPSVKELSERFNGNASGAIHTGKAANGAPSNLSRAGKLVFLKVAGKTLRIPGATVAIAPNEKLWIVAESSPVFQRRAPKGQALDYGEVQAICYDTAKSHIGGGKRYEYEHQFGEDGGKKPHLLVDDEGMPILKGGDYKIRAEGIVN